MTAPKPGDRVRVEYEATYYGDDRVGGLVEFPGHPGDDIASARIPAHAKLTVLPKPLRVGDKVRLGEDPEPPDDAVLLFADGDVIKRCGAWTFASRSDFAYDWAAMVDMSRGDVATVVWLPGGAS